MPRKDNDPVGIRNFLTASEGYVFVDFDFSQIELRVGSWYCRDKKMLETYMIKIYHLKIKFHGSETKEFKGKKCQISAIIFIFHLIHLRLI